MNRPALITSEKKQESPILIVDRRGLIGSQLARQLKEESLIVFVSKKQPEDSEGIVYIPFVKKIPTIPDNSYSHILLIDEDLEISTEILDSFIKKASKDKSVFTLVVNRSTVKNEFTTNFVDSSSRAKIALLGDIFSGNNLYENKSEINQFIFQAKNLNKIKVPGNGTKEVAPVYFDDVISGILQTIFNSSEKDKIFYIFPKQPVTLLSLSHMFMRKNPNLHVDFIKDSKVIPVEFVPIENGTYVLGDKYNLEDKIKLIDFEKINTALVKEEVPFKADNKSGFSWRAIIVALIFFLFLPLIFTLVFAFTGTSSLYSAKASLEGGNLSLAKASASTAITSFNLAVSSIGVMAQGAKLIGQEKKVDEYVVKLNFAKKTSEALFSLTDSAEKIKAVLSGKSKNSASDFSAAIVELKHALFVYDQGKQAKMIPQDIAEQMDEVINIVSPTIDLWPDILGFKKQKTYLVFLQNNTELRPGGGFIGSYGLLVLNKGRLISFKIYDVYDADGQLREHIEPPFALRRYLPIKNWFMRDSNFNVDFSKGAVAGAVFLNSETRESVDGIIGVDLTLVRDLLAVIGPLQIVDYKETVNSDNLFKITQSHVEQKFFPGSTQKKDFLRSLFNALQLKLSEDKNIPYLKLLKTIAISIYDKHVLLTFNNIEQQATLAVNGWSSSLSDQREIRDGKLNDFIGINEANMGANKVNYYVSRSMLQKVTIQDDGTVLENLTVAIKNNSQKDSFGGGVYKNYQRIILPIGATLTKIQIDGKTQVIVPAVTDPSVYEKKGFVAPSGIEVEKQDQGQNTIYGFLLTLQPQDLRTIRIEYQLAQKINLSKTDLAYSLKIFKQPGVDSYPYDFSLTLPAKLKVLNPQKDIKIISGKAILSTQLGRDREILISIAKN